MTVRKPQVEADADVSTIPRELLDVVRAFVAELHRGAVPSQAVTLDASLDKDLGLDSLARVELVSRIERHFHVVLPEALINEAETPRDLLRALAGAAGQSAVIARAPRSAGEIRVAATEPVAAQTLIDVLQWHATHHGARDHLRFFHDDAHEDVLSYAELAQHVQAIAGALQHVGLRQGRAVAIMLPTGRDYFFAFLGILAAGGVPVPIYPPARPNQLEDHLQRHAAILNNCQAELLITVPEAKTVARLLKAQVGSLNRIVTPSDLAATNAALQPVTLSPQHVAFIQYTSGSTGNPKGVVLSHANLLANIRAMGQRVRASSDDVFVSWLPLYHDMGLIGAWLGSLYYGSLFVVMSPLSFLAKPQRWLWAIHRYRGTLSAAPNFGYELCLSKIDERDIEGLDLGSWRAAFNGAEAVSPETVTRFAQRFAPHGFQARAMMPVYGLAESTVGLAFPQLDRGVVIDRVVRDTFAQTGHAVPASADDANALRFVACGQPLVGHDIRIVDEFGQEVPDRQQGRVQFCGPSATVGYFRHATATRQLFDGAWLNTGDLGYLADGDLHPTGRTKDIIIRAGRNLYPHELEESVGAIPSIRKGRVAVFGAMDAATGTERLVVLAETRETDAETLQQLRTQINALAVDLIGGAPDEIVLAPPNTVLKTSSGKIRRSACREQFERGQLGAARRPVWLQVLHLLLIGFLPRLRRAAQAAVAYAYQRYAIVMFYAVAVVAWSGVVLAPVPAWRWRTMRGCTRFLSRVVGSPIRVSGREHLLPATTPCVYVANHASYLDGPILIAALDREFAFIAKAELSRDFVSGLFLRRIGAEFVERFDFKQGVKDAERIAAVAKARRSLCFFPEGTFVRAAGLLPFHMGAFVIAAQLGLPIVPVAVRGSRHVLRGDDGIPRRGTIGVVIGAPIAPDRMTADEDAWSIALRLRDRAREHIARHCGEP